MSVQDYSGAGQSRYSGRQNGFTLVEILVVVMMVAIMSAAVVLGVGAVNNRQLQGQAEQLLSWLQWTQQASMLSGANYGVAEHEDILFVVAPVNGKWYRVVGLEQWSIADGMSLELPDDAIDDSSTSTQVDIIENDDQSQFLPFMVFSNIGLIQPMDNISLISEQQKLTIDWSSGNLALIAE